MAPESSGQGKGKGSSESDSSASVVESIKALAAYNARAELNTEEQIFLFLRSWWSRTYNRPLKDPLLATYTFEELLYEFYDRKEREEAQLERVNSETDKMDDDKEKAALDWAEQEELRELEAAKQPTENPTKDPANVAWMEEQIKKAKEVYGDSFGEDINEDFSS